MFFRGLNIQAHCNEAVLCLNFGTPENNEFSIWDTVNNEYEINWIIKQSFCSTVYVILHDLSNILQCYHSSDNYWNKSTLSEQTV